MTASANSISAVRASSDLLADARHAEYAAYNVGRHASAWAACMSVRPDVATEVLDVGLSDFTRRLREHYREVWTLGFPGPTERHITFNLNDAPIAAIAMDRRFDLICFNEVIEHLHAAPEHTLGAVAALLRPGGHIIVQTPNAAALNKRLLLLLGRNPFERLRTDHTNPGHLRELTKAELARRPKPTSHSTVTMRRPPR